MHELGKNLSENKKPFFPQFVENTRKNLFYADWFSGLMRMEYFEEIVGGLITKDVEFFLCRIDVVDFSGIKYKIGRKKASEIILFISTVLKEYVGSDAVARTSEDVFTFIVRSDREPKELLNEIIEKIEPKTECSIRFAYVSYPKNGKNVDKLIYRLDKKHRMGGYRRNISFDS